jgi:hypothetical protein
MDGWDEDVVHTLKMLIWIIVFACIGFGVLLAVTARMVLGI